MLRVIGTALAVLLGQALSPATVPAQSGVEAAGPAAMPFGPGERLDYDVTLGRGFMTFHVGGGSFQVNGIESVRGRATYRLEMRLHGGALGVRIDEDMTSWLDVVSLISRRFQQDQKEFHYERHRTLEFFPEEKRYFQPDKNENGAIATDQPLDDISFLYYARSLPLEVGQVYTLQRYFDPAGNPVTLRVLRRDTVKVPAGTFATIVVQPMIQTKGIFGQGGHAEVYFTDDARRLPVQVRSSVPFVGKLNMYLKSWTVGEPLTTGWNARAQR
jgi:hypothetical protein